MKNKINVSIGIDYDEQEYEDDSGLCEVKIAKEISYEPAWTDLLKLFIQALEGHGYVISEDLKYIFETVNGMNAEKIAELIAREKIN